MSPIGKRILVTGTPGVGKTTLSLYIKDKINAKVVNISKMIKRKKIQSKACKLYNTLEYSPKDVKRYLKRKIKRETNYIFDTHDPESVNQINFDIIIVLTCDLNLLSNRYKEREYSEIKTEENLESEIMEIVYNDVIEELCTTEEDINSIIRISTSKDTEPKNISEIYQEITEHKIWNRLNIN